MTSGKNEKKRIRKRLSPKGTKNESTPASMIGKDHFMNRSAKYSFNLYHTSSDSKDLGILKPYQ